MTETENEVLDEDLLDTLTEGERVEEGGFEELLRYTLPGYALGLILGAVLDGLGYQTSAVGNWLVRTLAGESESFFEGIYAVKHRLQGHQAGLAEVYGWGKLIGLVIPWIIGGVSRAAGVDLIGVEGFYVPYFYGMSDQIMASISGLIFFRRREGSWGKGVGTYIQNPVMVSGLILILALPLILFLGRWVGFRPQNQMLTAAETMVANLCWIPPVVGAYYERVRRRLAPGS